MKLASAFHSLSLIAKFSLSIPPIDIFEHHVNSSWGLTHPATVGLIDPKHILIHLQSKDDFAKAWSRESRIFDNRIFLLLRWTPDFTKSKDSSFSATWLRHPSLPLPCQNPAILEVIGNSLGRYLRLDERTRKMKHPMSPRMCVEMNLAFKLPDEVVIAIGTKEILHQKIEYDMRIGFCYFCHLQGHHEGICRKKQSQATSLPAEPSTSSPQGNAPIPTPSLAVVGAALPAGILRPSARRPNRTHVSVSPTSLSHPPPVCFNAPMSSSMQPSSLPPLTQAPILEIFLLTPQEASPPNPPNPQPFLWPLLTPLPLPKTRTVSSPRTVSLVHLSLFNCS
ncbi:DUF4283 domain-containing protein, partial [Cephalotus follicularis]